LSAPISFVDPPDGLSHRLIAQQRGDILVWDGSSSTPLATSYLDLSSTNPITAQRKVLSGGERGLLSIAVHPNYAGNGFIYLYYTSSGAWDGAGGIADGDIIIERYTRDATNPDRADPDSGFIILRIPHSSATNHNGGDLRFGPDGYLYITIGDGGGGCDSVAHSGQDVNQLLGKMLRIDVDGVDAFAADTLRNYAIPTTNPLVGVAGLDEIWALGLRNPFRFSFDRSNGDIFIGDVGQDDWEEINWIASGTVSAGTPVNFGWPCREGFDASGCSAPPQGCGTAASYTEPVRVEANVGEGGNWRAIIGGYRYRGTQTSDLTDRYIYGEASGVGDVWAATPAGFQPEPGWASSSLFASQGPYAFGEDNLGELYLLSAWQNLLFCFQPAGGDCTTWAGDSDSLAVFGDGFESGDFSQWAGTTP
jgi:glucose/arabinose dehydrogenase